MRRNKKNFGDPDWRLNLKSKKYEIYKTEN